MIEGKPLRHIVRAENVQAYSPANHLETQNRRLIGPETVGAKNIEIVLGVVSKGGGAQPHLHPGIEQVVYVLEGRARAEVDGEAGEMGPGDSVNTGMSFQAVDADHSLVARAIKQVPPGQVTGDITALLQAGQIPHATFMELNPDGSSKSASEGFRPEQLNLRSYAYSSAQRPGVRVREVIQGSHIGKGYWRFNDAYHMQSGNGSSEGDLPGEFKFLYGATVIRDTKRSRQ